MKTFVLVHGAWHGAWCWKRVLPRLRGVGHEAHAVTLTGTGERAHLLSKDIRLATHIQDVVNLITHEELDHVTLVGHSYGGIVITGVADQLLQQGRVRIERMVYIDAVTPHDGESWSSGHTQETIAGRIQAGAATGNISVPAPDASVFGLHGEDRNWVNRRQTPQPFGVYQDPLHFDAQRIAGLPRTFIDCTNRRCRLSTSCAAVRVASRAGSWWN